MSSTNILKGLGFLFLICSVGFIAGCNADGSSGRVEFTEHVLQEEEEFEQSGHGDEEAEAFNHWDEDVPPEVPVDCAKCHNTAGFLDFLGITDPNERLVDNPVAIDPNADNALDCDICHNEKTDTWDTVIFPSGAVVDGTLGREALCMECHQGRTSVFDVLTAVGTTPDDTVDPALQFINIHYFAAAATRYGTEVQGGFEYAGQTYAGYFAHVPQADICYECHLPHSLRVNVELCSQCHPEVQTEEDVVNIRLPRPSADFNGNGDTTEGISFEIAGLRDILYEAMQIYGATTPGTNPIIYAGDTYPYFFIDTNGNGLVDAGEATFANRYNTWTPSLLKAAYNMQYTITDPGCSPHNADYVMQLLYDSIVDLGTVDTSGLVRP
ncbi:MAG: polyheme membrane-associated cytochrome C [Candidatus Abyssobacteria bacterium SURF_5]|uniref:Polyheme membrane-associated cytochrome C n=1 Tax=Abyssobacteria bacterium (strain SURF_5) TaxID=2093360 RepID=A0A3A4NYU1_ABYX5|nr:MAG: polyheme membrane-associated cytochrome C [Candidatus Abyssubacteria bacterium SURF_5]